MVADALKVNTNLVHDITYKRRSVLIWFTRTVPTEVKHQWFDNWNELLENYKILKEGQFQVFMHEDVICPTVH